MTAIVVLQLEVFVVCCWSLMNMKPAIKAVVMQVGEAKRVLIQSGQVEGDENSGVAGQMSGLAISA